MKNSNQGVTLIELAVSALVFSGLLMVVMSITKDSKRMETRTLGDIKTLELHQLLSSVLLDKGSCEKTFVDSGLKIGDDIPAIKDSQGLATYTLNSDYGDGHVRVTAMKTEDKGQPSADGTRMIDLVLSFSKPKDLPTGNTITKRISMRVKAAGATDLITECYSTSGTDLGNTVADACTSSGGTWSSGPPTSCTYPSLAMKAGDTLTGDVTAPLFKGPLSGSVLGGNLVGNVTGNFTGSSITGNLLGDITTATTGNFSGDVLVGGKVQAAFLKKNDGSNPLLVENLISAQACGGNEFMRSATSSGTAVCAPIPATDCGANSFLSKVNADGSLECTPLGVSVTDFDCGATGSGKFAQDIIGGTPTCVTRKNAWKRSSNGYYFSDGLMYIGLPSGSVGLFYLNSATLPANNELDRAKFHSRLMVPVNQNGTFINTTSEAVIPVVVGGGATSYTSGIVYNSMGDIEMMSPTDQFGALSIKVEPMNSIGKTSGLDVSTVADLENISNVVDMRGLKIDSILTSNGTITANRQFGLSIISQDTATINERYGLYLKMDNFAAIPSGNNYGINQFISGATIPAPTNYIAGKVYISSTPPTLPLTRQFYAFGGIYAKGCIQDTSGYKIGDCASDIRFKENIVSFDLGLDALLKIRPRTFYFNGKGGIPDTGIQTIGLIAQEVEKFVPELVNSKEIFLGHFDNEEKAKVKQVKYSALGYMLINSIKEFYERLNKGFEILENKIIHLAESLATVSKDLKNIEDQIERNERRYNILFEIACDKRPLLQIGKGGDKTCLK